MEVFTGKLTLIFVIHSIETLAYAVRLSGARVKMIASALALFNVMVIVSRLANMMHQPFTGNLIDTAPPAYGLQMVEEQYRILIAASTAGTVAGIIVFPTFIALFSRAIIHLANEKGSIPALIKKGFSMEFFMRGWKHFRLPKRTDIKEIRFSDIPMKLFLMNMIITVHNRCVSYFIRLIACTRTCSYSCHGFWIN